MNYRILLGGIHNFRICPAKKRRFIAILNTFQFCAKFFKEFAFGISKYVYTGNHCLLKMCNHVQNMHTQL